MWVLGDPSSNIGTFVSAILAQPKLTLPGKFVIATTEIMTNGDILRIWSEVTGNKTVYIQVSLEDFNNLFPDWGLEMGLNLKMWEDEGDNSWDGETLIGREELGIKSSDLVDLRTTLTAIDWNLV
jgi:hypothetical protein